MSRSNLGLSNLSNTVYKNVRIGAIVQSFPRKYTVTCRGCQSSWTTLHQELERIIAGGSSIRCKNSACATGLLSVDQGRQAHVLSKHQEYRQELADFQERMARIYGPAIVFHEERI
jgi:hypothetical protein